MAKASNKMAVQTTLAMGALEIGVGLFVAHSDPKKKLVEFDTAGPNGGVLRMRSVARAVPIEETVERPAEPVTRTDPFGDDLFAGAPPAETEAETPAPAAELQTPEGAYGSELVEDGTGEVVAPADVRHGVRLEDGRFIDCTRRLAEIDSVTRLEKMDVYRFVPATAIHRARVRKTYWLGAADEKAPPALRLLYEGMKETGRMALVKVTKRSRQSLGAIGVYGKALMFFELVWAEDFREPPERASVIQQARVTEEQIEMAVQLVLSRSGGPGLLDELRDDAIALREDLHARALRGELEADEADVEALEEDDALMAQLEASLAGVG